MAKPVQSAADLDKTRGAARICLHRFHDCAALSVLKARGTVYLDAKAARALARDLNRLARSIEGEAFTNHTFKAGEDLPAFESSYHIPPKPKRAAPAWEIVFHHGGGFRAIRNGAETDSDVLPYEATRKEAEQSARETWGPQYAA